MAALLALDRLAKRYGAVRAVEDVSVEFEAGQVHAVLGENGAGKSTLLKMAAGIALPDGGEVRVAGERLVPHNPREAIRRGVGMVQQHFALVGVLTAIENVMLGAEPVGALGRLDAPAALTKAEAVARSIGVSIPWSAPVETLGVGDRQRLEIVRALVREAQVLILDEPTAVLTPGEADALYGTLRRLAEAGRAVVVVTHHMDEVRDHADVVSVMRRGRLVRTRAMTSRDASAIDAILRDVMGEELAAPPERHAREPGDVLLDVRDVAMGRALRGVSLSVRAGEVVGIAGVEGNGQHELVRVVAGVAKPDSGSVQIEPAPGRSRRDSVAVVYEDRHAEGLVLAASVRDNLVLGELGRFARFGIVDRAKVESEARARLDRARVVPPDLGLHARALSGGNQQKVVVGRAVARAERTTVFVFTHPTRGVDLGAARLIHGEIARVAEAGKAVVVISSDLGELRAVADRILVIARGRFVAELPPDATDARIGEAMLGAAAAEGA
jgi:simple sugar transport system ATP-binding protein